MISTKKSLTVRSWWSKVWKRTSIPALPACAKIFFVPVPGDEQSCSHPSLDNQCCYTPTLDKIDLSNVSEIGRSQLASLPWMLQVSATFFIAHWGSAHTPQPLCELHHKSWLTFSRWQTSTMCPTATMVTHHTVKRDKHITKTQKWPATNRATKQQTKPSNWPTKKTN